MPTSTGVPRSHAWSRVERDAWSPAAQVDALLAEIPVEGGYRARPRRIYVDTSVVGGCYDDAFEQASQRLFALFRRGELTLVYSDELLNELRGAPRRVRDLLRSVPLEHTEFVKRQPSAERLAAELIEKGLLRRRARADAAHIAYATIAQVERMASWNFKDMVNPGRVGVWACTRQRTLLG